MQVRVPFPEFEIIESPCFEWVADDYGPVITASNEIIFEITGDWGMDYA